MDNSSDCPLSFMSRACNIHLGGFLVLKYSFLSLDLSKSGKSILIMKLKL